MTPQQAHTKAERCFALARSTTFDGEREAAIARGIGIAERAKLDLDAFDIPGRKRTAQGRRSAARPVDIRSARGERAPDSYSVSSIMEALARFNQNMAAAARAAGAGDDETVYDARRRNFDEACAAARQRDALKTLRWAGWLVQPRDGQWVVLGPDGCDVIDDAGLIALSERIAA